MSQRVVSRVVLTVLIAAGTLWLAALFGFASGFLSGDPPDISPYANGDDAVTTTAAVAAGVLIIISGFDFGDPVTAAAGDPVTVVNRDGDSHTWTSSDQIFDSGPIDSGASFGFTFDSAGSYEFFCAIHPQMTGSLTVTG